MHFSYIIKAFYILLLQRGVFGNYPEKCQKANLREISCKGPLCSSEYDCKLRYIKNLNAQNDGILKRQNRQYRPNVMTMSLL